jgi:hypothetical protein
LNPAYRRELLQQGWNGVGKVFLISHRVVKPESEKTNFKSCFIKPVRMSRKPAAFAESFGGFDKDGAVDICSVNFSESPSVLRKEVKEPSH